MNGNYKIKEITEITDLSGFQFLFLRKCYMHLWLEVYFIKSCCFIYI